VVFSVLKPPLPRFCGPVTPPNNPEYALKSCRPTMFFPPLDRGSPPLLACLIVSLFDHPFFYVVKYFLAIDLREQVARLSLSDVAPLLSQFPFSLAFSSDPAPLPSGLSSVPPFHLPLLCRAFHADRLRFTDPSFPYKRSSLFFLLLFFSYFTDLLLCGT